MKYLSTFQKAIVDELVKLPTSKPINLGGVLSKFLPSDLHIGKSDFDMYCIWYRIDELDYVHSEISIKILEFTALIDELVKNDYVVSVDRTKIAFENISIGKKVESSEYGWIRLSTNLTYIDLQTYFLKLSYYPTEKLELLPKYKYKAPDEYQIEKNIKSMEWSVRWAAIAAIASMLSAIASIFVIICK